MNEEMYEEEDDDLPMQFRRINALNPGFAFNAFNERVNNYLAGQIGVRNYLHQAIYQANQTNQYNSQFLNPMMQQNGTMSPQAMSGFQQSPFPMQSMMPPSHSRHQSTSPTLPMKSPAMGMDGRRMSMPVQTTTPSSVSHPRSASSSQPPTPQPHQKSGQSPEQVPTPPHTAQPQQGSQSAKTSPLLPGSDAHERSIYPLTTKLPVETQQLIDGSPAFANSVYPSQMTAGVPMPSSMGSYSYNPNGKSKHNSHSSSSKPYGLDQTLTPFVMHSSQTASPPFSEPQSAASAPADLDFGMHGSMYNDMGAFNDPNYTFDFGYGNAAHTSGQITPASNVDPSWNDTDFFNYAAASD